MTVANPVTVALAWVGDVAIVRMTYGENRFHPDLLDPLERALDEVEARTGPAAVVLTGSGKFFSNGLDLEYLGGVSADQARATLGRVHRLLARVLGFPAYTVAAIGGHAFAAGAMLALACDERVMRADRGYFCLPEVDLGLPFTAGMTALITSRLSPATAHQAMVTGRRYGGVEAAERGIVDIAVDITGAVDVTVGEERVVDEAVERAAAMTGKSGSAIGAIKGGIYATAIAALESHGAGSA
jgi:Delta3-Delta2-enoyl-CoA isomerase